jgi:hypothetical protein
MLIGDAAVEMSTIAMSVMIMTRLAEIAIWSIEILVRFIEMTALFIKIALTFSINILLIIERVAVSIEKNFHL